MAAVWGERARWWPGWPRPGASARLGSVPPGFHTPSTAFGPRYVTDLDAVTLSGPDLRPAE